MKYSVPEISWHNRDPVLSADFQPRPPGSSEPRRLATAGTDSHVLIWHLSLSDNGAVSLEVAADLARHQKAVNVARWSPSGEYLATGDDEAIIFVWKQKTDKDPPPIFDQADDQDRETWIVHKTLRGHMEDVLDISWDPSSTRLASGSVDNKLICWDVHKGRSTAIVADHKGFVQGVAWDPNDQYLASMSTDRVFRTFDVTSKKVTSRSSKAILPVPPAHTLHGQSVRLYYDDTLQTYFRRLHFSPDGMLIAVPSGHIEVENGQAKPVNAVFVYTRYSLKTPACILPCGDTTALVVRWSPVSYALRRGGPTPAFPLQRRMLLAVATKTTVLLYDTQQKTPVAIISNIHYTRLTDLTWSSDGQILVASSTDGFCSVISFSENELGDRLVEENKPPIKQTDDIDMLDDNSPQKATEVKKISPEAKKPEVKEAKRIEIKGNSKLQAFLQFKIPTEKNKIDQSPKTEKAGPITIDLIDETAMAPWSEDSNSGMKTKVGTPMAVDENSEDIKLVYEESQTDVKPELKETMTNKKSEEKEKATSEEPMQVSSPKKTKTEEIKTTPAISPPPKPVAASASKIEQNVCSSPKTPRRVSFVTLSSPKNPKKKC